MHTSTVWWTDLHTRPGRSLLAKFEQLLVAAGIDTIDVARKFVAIKIHFGEPGNLAYIRPNYARTLVTMLQQRKAIPFLTDCNTLYKGRRANAVDHLQSAWENGFEPLTVGCPIIIADGLKGTDQRDIPTGCRHCPTAHIGSAIADADIIISMNHFKGHELTGIGGALKNIGMGSGSVPGKLAMHSDSKPTIREQHCTGCGQCERNCAHDAIHVNGGKASIDSVRCVGCGQCIAVCMFRAAVPRWDSKTTQEKIMEYAKAVLTGKPSFHINFVTSVSPNCDCNADNDIPLVHDLGIAASFDPVALDQACADMVNAAPVNPASSIAKAWMRADPKRADSQPDKFTLAQPRTDWRLGLAYAEEIGLGSRHYRLEILH